MTPLVTKATNDKINVRPPDREDRQEVLMCAREEFQEDSTVDGEVSADAEVPSGDERAQRDRGRRPARSEREYASDKEGQVERQSYCLRQFRRATRMGS